MDLHLTDKVALVTGGSRGLGRAICLALAAEGVRVAINYRSGQAEAQEVQREIGARFGRAAAIIAGNVALAADVRAMFDATEAQLGPVDILVNNAGVWPKAQVVDMTEEDWDRTLQINLKGPFLTCREAVRRWLGAQRGGRIVNITSPAAFLGATTGHAHYAASKAGLVSFTVSLAREVAARGIAVNALAPGMMETDMARDALDANLQHYLNRIPLGRIASPAEIADAVVLLASDRSSYTTGATLDVSGGMLMR